jgi:hypothetical protein
MPGHDIKINGGMNVSGHGITGFSVPFPVFIATMILVFRM